MRLDQLPDDVLLCILQYCGARELAALSSTCSLFHRLTCDDFIWKNLSHREFDLSLLNTGDIKSYRKLYTNLLHKYGLMLGLYQSQIGPLGGLLEIRYCDGKIEGVSWEPSSMQDVSAPLTECVFFSVPGDRFLTPQCFPGPNAHPCSLTFDKWQGIVTQLCFYSLKHTNDSSDLDLIHLNPNLKRLRLIFLNEVMGRGLEHKPLFIPTASSIPKSLLNKDGSVPKQIITPGLFQGYYGSHGHEIILFKYKDENEMCGYKVTGDVNVYANKVTVKIQLKYPVAPSKADQKCLETLKNMEPARTDAGVHKILEQPFYVPAECFEPTTPFPARCTARYHGFGQVASEWYQNPSFTPVQVVIFNNDLLGVLWLEMSLFSLYSRIKKKFTSNALKIGTSAL